MMTPKHTADVGCHDSNIDLVVTNNTMCTYVGYKQLDDAWGDFPLVVDVGFGSRVYHKLSNRLSTVCTDWRLYQEVLERCEAMFDGPQYKENTIDRQYGQFIDTLRYVVLFVSKK